MTVYTKTSCPKCRTTIQNWSNTLAIDTPIKFCPKCEIPIKIPYTNEWEAINVFHKIYYCYIYCAQGLIFGGFIPFILITGFDLLLDANFVSSETMPVILFFSFLGSFIGFLYNFKNLRKDILKSKERMKDVLYRSLVLSK
jgi:hypothetical protein